MKWENLVSVHRCRQNSRVLTSGQPKKSKTADSFQLRLGVQLLWHPLCPSPYYPNLVSHCSRQQVWLIIFSQAHTGTICCGSQEVTVQVEHPGSAGGKMGYAEVTVSAEKNVC